MNKSALHQIVAALRPMFDRAVLIAVGSALTTVALAGDLPTPQEYGANWPRFRGPDGSGVYAPGDIPVTCDPATGRNVAWITQVPISGFSSPIVWGDRLFVSGGDESQCAVMCLDTRSGAVSWRSAVPKIVGDAAEPEKAPDESGMAAATTATDGLRVYAMFANGVLAAFDLSGKVVWSKRVAVPKNPYGFATSLVTWRDRVIVQFDQGDPDDQLSKLYAFDGATGTVVWQQPRPVGTSWATPIVFDAAGKSQIVTLGVPWVISYASSDGSEIWRADCLDGEVTPSPIFRGGMLFVVSPTVKLQAIRPDGQGDVTGTHLGWEAEDNIPDVSSPVSDGQCVFVVNTPGILTCYDAKTGRKHWEHDLGDACKASPSIAGNKLYVVTMHGALMVVEAAPQFKELGRSTLGEEVFASPAFAQSRMFVRGVHHLICIEAAAHEPVKP
ncbi:MAG: PQQ-binding-like beta-propeller repeat protein [Planctomycetes bacterium]|nr:PQQ-binding-like beta-propeller repeat protein [Planctomycetota bacterium]